MVDKFIMAVIIKWRLSGHWSNSKSTVSDPRVLCNSRRTNRIQSLDVHPTASSTIAMVLKQAYHNSTNAFPRALSYARFAPTSLPPSRFTSILISKNITPQTAPNNSPLPLHHLLNPAHPSVPIPIPISRFIPSSPLTLPSRRRRRGRNRHLSQAPRALRKLRQISLRARRIAFLMQLVDFRVVFAQAVVVD